MTSPESTRTATATAPRARAKLLDGPGNAELRARAHQDTQTQPPHLRVAPYASDSRAFDASTRTFQPVSDVSDISRQLIAQ